MLSLHRPTRKQSGFTVLELLVVVAIIGILAGLILPAVVSAREAARNISCRNNLRQLGIAFQQHHDAKRTLPAAWKEASGTLSLYGWTVQLLPYLEQLNLSSRIEGDQPQSKISNASAKEMSLVVMLCPSDIAEPFFDLYVDHDGHDDDDDEDQHEAADVPFANLPAEQLIATLPTANYVGVFGTIEADDDYPAPIGDGSVIVGRRVRYADLRRGLSKTIIVGERTMAMVPSTWLGVDIRGEDATCRLVGSAMTHPNCDDCDECEFTSRHSGGVNFLWADGHVGVLVDEIDSAAYQEMALRRQTR